MRQCAFTSAEVFRSSQQLLRPWWNDRELLHRYVFISMYIDATMYVYIHIYIYISLYKPGSGDGALRNQKGPMADQPDLTTVAATPDTFLWLLCFLIVSGGFSGPPRAQIAGALSAQIGILSVHGGTGHAIRTRLRMFCEGRPF